MGRGITDAELIELIRDRVLIQSPDGCVQKWHDSRKRYVRLMRREHKGRGQYVIRLADRYRKIQSSKLLWMLEKHRVVPPGHEIDHIDQDRENDAISNLRCIPASQNNERNFSKRQLKEACVFFEQKGNQYDVV